MTGKPELRLRRLEMQQAAAALERAWLLVGNHHQAEIKRRWEELRDLIAIVVQHGRES